MRIALRRVRSLRAMPSEEVTRIVNDFAISADLMNMVEDDFKDDAFSIIPS